MTSASTGKPDAKVGLEPSLAGSERLPPRPLVLGHRGHPHQATENTLRSFDLALRSGADGVELDVRLARDGEAVIIHDDELGRTMGEDGTVSRLDSGAIVRKTNARVPLLSEVAAWAAASGAWVNFEIKSPGAEEAVGREIHRTGVERRSIVSSFDAEVVRHFGELHPELLRYFLTERWDAQAHRDAEHCGAQGVCLRIDAATPANVEDVQAHGYQVVVWTVNDPAEVKRLARAGVSAIISDDPQMAARAVAETQR